LEGYPRRVTSVPFSFLSCLKTTLIYSHSENTLSGYLSLRGSLFVLYGFELLVRVLSRLNLKSELIVSPVTPKQDMKLSRSSCSSSTDSIVSHQTSLQGHQLSRVRNPQNFVNCETFRMEKDRSPVVENKNMSLVPREKMSHYACEKQNIILKN